MKRFLIGVLCLLLTTPLWAIDYHINKSTSNMVGEGVIAKSYNSSSIGITQGINSGVTFYKNYGSNTLDAYALGNGVATISMSGNSATFANGGVSMSTVRRDVLKYEIQNNRTAPQETIAVKFEPSSDFANDGVTRHIIDTNTKQRAIYKPNTSTIARYNPNYTDSVGCATNTTSTLLLNTSYVITAVAYGPTAGKNAEMYFSGIPEGSTTTNYISPAWGTNFYIGSNNAGATQLNGLIKSVAIWNRPLTSTEVKQASELMRVQ